MHGLLLLLAVFAVRLLSPPGMVDLQQCHHKVGLIKYVAACHQLQCAADLNLPMPPLVKWTRRNRQVSSAPFFALSVLSVAKSC